MRLASVLIAAALSLSMAGCTRAAEDADFGQKVRAYLLEHPEVIQEAVEKLREKQEAQAVSNARAALDKHRNAIERDPRDFVANPNGKITVTEFYDYRCSFCIRAAPAVMELIQKNPDVRFVFKEMPIFGEVSEHAARTAIAVKSNGGDYLAFHRELMSTPALNAAAVDRIAKTRGVDPAKTAAGAAREAADAQIAAVHELAKELGIEGTPTFIVGNTIVPGADLPALQAAIEEQRAGLKKG